MTQPPFITVHTVEVRPVVIREVIVIPVCPFGCTSLVLVRDVIVGWDFIVSSVQMVNLLYVYEMAMQAINRMATWLLPQRAAAFLGDSQSQQRPTTVGATL